MFQLERVYDHLSGAGPRFLVERLWPRGVKKADLRMDAWLRDVAPSTGLRQWFAHDPGKWDEFQRRYTAELESEPDAWAPLLEAGRKRQVTLLFSSHDAEHNNAVVLKEFLERRLNGGSRSGQRKAEPAPKSATAKSAMAKSAKPKSAKAKTTRVAPKSTRTRAASSSGRKRRSS